MTTSQVARVRRLPATLANQISAGEVVERPASVIKELLENSVDAGATRLDIDVEQGGISLVKVRDDGCGIHQDDLVLALSRHATSKVASLSELEAVRSLGFRGEALPSMASVARVELFSRSLDQANAWQVVVDGEEINTQPQPASHPQGTTVVVRDLFFNTPARRKFLRTEKTELRHIEEVIRRIALSRFDIEVRFRHNSRPVWMLPKAADESSSLRRLSKLCGRPFCENALRIDFEAGEMRVHGWLGMPGFGRRQTDLQHFFLNGRIVRDRVVTHAIRQAYEADLPPGVHPVFVLYLEMDPSRVDVNVHPAKNEVRFRDSRSVHDFLFRSLNRALAEHRDPTLGIEHANMSTISGIGSRSPGTSTVGEQLAVYGELGRFGAVSQTSQSENVGELGTVLTVLEGKYLITVSSASLVVIDLVQARRYIIYQRLKDGHSHGQMQTRPLLLPVNQNVTEKAATLVESAANELSELGLEIRRLGPENISLRQIPIALEHAEPNRVIDAVIELLSASGSDIDALLMKLAACAAGTNIPSSPAALNDLLRTLENFRMGVPHHPVCYRLNLSDLSKVFENGQ